MFAFSSTDYPSEYLKTNHNTPSIWELASSDLDQDDEVVYADNHGIGGQLDGNILQLFLKPSAPSEDQLPSTAHNSLVTRLRSILIFYGNQVRHLTRSTPHRAQVSSANPGDEALAASPNTMHELATTCQMKGHKPSTCPKIQQPPEGHVDDRKA
uniref:Uncharacterized protein n=1 Tax=Fagus sylvatica TaxID=28930 RepID=A0A2N9HGR3_FAGSY